jgi:hypothetical protein
LRIDDCRIETTDEISLHGRKATENGWDARWSNAQTPQQTEGQKLGRWPSNLLLSDPELFDQPNPYVVGSGAVSGGGEFVGPTSRLRTNEFREGTKQNSGMSEAPDNYGDSGGYSRFFRIPGDDLIGHLTKLVSAPGEVVYDPFPFVLRTAP